MAAWGKGKGPKGWQQQKPGWEATEEGLQPGELLSTVISEAVANCIHLEKEWDSNKLEKKIREYCNKAAKHMTFKGKNLEALINEYADNALGSLFAGLGDREWLYTGQADFILVLDAGVKENFPGHLFWHVSQNDFEQMVIAAHDRAFEEQRFGPLLSDQVQQSVQGPKTRKKVWNSIDAGRKEAQGSGFGTVDEYVACWINTSVQHLGEASQGAPDSVIDPEACAQLFHSLIQGGGLPLAMTNETGIPPVGWPLVDETVQSAYVVFTAGEEGEAVDPSSWAPGYGKGKAKGGGGWAAAPPAKRMKGGW